LQLDRFRLQSGSLNVVGLLLRNIEPLRGSIEEMRALPVVTQFDVVVICHSLLPEECDLSALIAKERWPKAKIVALSIMRPGYRSFADQVVRGIDGPEILLQAIDRLTRASPRSSCHI
jgi:hypothetical protein